MKKQAFVIGVDYGTDSVRSILVDCGNGKEIASSLFHYPRWKEGRYCDPSSNQFRQHPQDYIDGLEFTIRECLDAGGKSIAEQITGISVDTTGSTPVAVDESGIPLALHPAFAENPNAMFVLWKDHSSVKEAAAINQHAQKFDVNYLQFVGGIYSSEWFWAKLLHILRIDPAVRNSCHSWVEHCDWIPFLLTGGKSAADIRRGVCSAGHKALWAEEFGGLPPDEFFSSLDPLLKGFRSRLYRKTFTADHPAGKLSKEWAERLGLSTEVVVGIGAFDAHMGAVGGQIEPYHLSKVMGTSTCDMLVAPLSEVRDKLVRGICGQVPGSIIPGMMGMEAGQSAFGDAYAWFKSILMWPMEHVLAGMKDLQTDAVRKSIAEASNQLIALLSEQASVLPIDEQEELSMDWFNGRRTPDANQVLQGALTGLSLGTDAPKIFRSIVEGTCFGAKAIVDRFEKEGIRVKGLIGLGGVARKSPFIMQMMADIMGMPIRIHRSEQSCALGAAMFAATASGIFQNVEEAMQVMGPGFDIEYFPNRQYSSYYERKYLGYSKLGHFIEANTRE